MKDWKGNKDETTVYKSTGSEKIKRENSKRGGEKTFGWFCFELLGEGVGYCCS